MTECCTLLGSASVFGLSVLVQASFITDADGVSVVSFGMCTDTILWTGIHHFSGLANVVVITDTIESSFSVSGFQCLYSERMILFRGTTMDDYEIYLSHNDCVLNKSVLVDCIPTRTLFKDLITFKH